MVEEIAAAYGFQRVELGERLEGGYANDLLRVDADGRALVARVKHPPVDEADLAWEHALVGRLAERLPEVLPPLATTDGRTWITVREDVVALMAFVDAAPADPAHRGAAAEALGRLHAAGGSLDPGPRPRLRPLAELDWPDPAIPEELAAWGDVLVRERPWAIEHVARVARERAPVRGLIHGDIFPGNVLVAGGALVATIDWEEAQVDWLCWDVAIALGTFCARGDELDAGACQVFLARYREVGGTMPEAEDDLLERLVRVKRILEVLRAPGDRHPRWEHQLANLRSLSRLG